MRARALRALFLLGAVQGCAGLSGGPPDWLDGAADAYPRDRYLVGVGDADDLDAARDRARAEIARIFEVRIEGTVRDRAESVTTDGANTLVERLDVDTTTSTRADLEGLEVVEIWTDPETGRMHALAVLEKRAAARRLSQQAMERDAELEAHLLRARAAEIPLDRARSFTAAGRAARARDVAAMRARVVGVAPAGVATPTLDEVEAGRARALADIAFVVTASVVPSTGGEGEELAELRAALSARLTELGFQVRARGGSMDVACSVGLMRLERGEWTHFRWDGMCEVGHAGIALVTVRGVGDQSHPKAATARVKARSEAVRELVDALDRELRSYLAE